MADALTVEVGATASVPVAFESDFGVAAPAVPVAVAAEAPPIAAAAMSADGLSVEVAGVAVGATQVTLTLGAEVDHLPVNVVAPVAKHARMLTAAATFRKS